MRVFSGLSSFENDRKSLGIKKCVRGHTFGIQDDDEKDEIPAITTKKPQVIKFTNGLGTTKPTNHCTNGNSVISHDPKPVSNGIETSSLHDAEEGTKSETAKPNQIEVEKNGEENSSAGQVSSDPKEENTATTAGQRATNSIVFY